MCRPDKRNVPVRRCVMDALRDCKFEERRPRNVQHARLRVHIIYRCMASCGDWERGGCERLCLHVHRIYYAENAIIFARATLKASGVGDGTLSSAICRNYDGCMRAARSLNTFVHTRRSRRTSVCGRSVDIEWKYICCMTEYINHYRILQDFELKTHCK